MNTTRILAVFTGIILMLMLNHVAIGGKVYQWTDKKGRVHFSNAPVNGEHITLVYRRKAGDSIYQWTDEQGQVHYSDTPPDKTPEADISEIEIDTFANVAVKPERYSIVNQAERMAESRRRLEEERLLEKQIRLEERRIAEEMEVMRLNKLLREQGYGQRPYGFPYARVY